MRMPEIWIDKDLSYEFKKNVFNTALSADDNQGQQYFRRQKNYRKGFHWVIHQSPSFLVFNDHLRAAIFLAVVQFESFPC